MIKLNNSFLGFTDNLKPMQKDKIKNILNKLIKYNGEVMFYKEYILQKLVEGYKLEIEYDESHYTKNGSMTKPKNIYKLVDKNCKYNTYNVITKTEYDYANYLIQNNLITVDVVNDYVEAENIRLQVEKQKEIEEKLRFEEEKKQNELKEENFKTWLDEAVENYNNSDKLQLAIDIYNTELNQFYEFALKKLLVLIDNIDNSQCREKLISWLHCGNKTSKKVFYHVTGIKLDNTDKLTKEKLSKISSKDFTGIISYTPRNKKVKNEMSDTFYKLMTIPNPYFEAVTGEPIKKYDIEMFLVEEIKGYSLSHINSGCLIASEPTKEKLFDKLKYLVDTIGLEKMNKFFNELINNHGISPKCKEN